MITLTINGTEQEVDVPPDMPLLWVLRDHLGFVGTKFGCGMAQCGACTVHMDGVAIRSCQTTAEVAEGAKITTIEALSENRIGAALQQAWLEEDVPQCGYCQSGQLMSATNLLTDIPNPTDEDIEIFMAGNICRCGTYTRIRKAIRKAANTLSGVA